MRLSTAVPIALSLLPSGVGAQENQLTDMTIEGHIYKPARLEPTDERIAALQVPDGFTVTKFADGLEKPRIIAVADDGTVYVTRRDPGDVLMLTDRNRDGQVDRVEVVAERPGLHGIAIDGDRMYLAAVTEVFVTDIRDDGTLGELRTIIDDLPDGGQHPNRTLAIGPDDRLYITVGSTCNACQETNPESATILRADQDGGSRAVFASGLRNTIGFGWHPETGVLYGMDHGTDWHGNEQPDEELNRIEEGRKYGWPYVSGHGFQNPQDEPPEGTTREQWAQQSEQPVLLYTAHAAPMQMAFYTGDGFPSDYRGDAFVAMRGSWNRKPPSGYEVVRIRFENGEPTAIEPFLTGFLVEQPDGTHGYLGRPTGLAVTPDARSWSATI